MAVDPRPSAESVEQLTLALSAEAGASCPVQTLLPFPDQRVGEQLRPGPVMEPAEAVRIGPAAAGGKNLEVLSPTIGRQLLERGLIDEIDLHIAPVLLGEGIRLYANPGSEPISLHRLGEGGPTSAVNVRYRPTTTAVIPTEGVSSD